MAESSRRPWYAAALAAGFGAVLAVLFAFGLIGAPAHGSEPRVTQASTLPPGTISLDERLKAIEGTLKTLSDDMADVKARLPPRKP